MGTVPEMHSEEQSQLHIIIFPFLAQGHLIPAIPLAIAFASRPCTTVTLISTPRNTDRLRSSLPPDSTVRVNSLPFHPPDHGLPEDGGNFDSLPVELLVVLLHATLCLREPLCTLLADIKTKEGEGARIALLADPPYGWTVEVAREFGATHAITGTFPGYSSAVYCALWRHLPHLHMAEGETEFRLPGFPETTTFHLDQLTDEIRFSDGTDAFTSFMREQFGLTEASDGFICNTIEELDRDGIALFEKNEKLKLYPVGPLLQFADPKTQQQRAGRKTSVSVQACTEWLSSHPPASVLYISFGSQYAISAQQMMTLATALEESGVAFVWVVRPPVGFDMREEFRGDEWLPPGFESRITGSGKGLLIRRWAPQMDILGHPSTGGFVSHCGWNSTMEAFTFGVPILAWPLACEQFFNANIAENLGVGVEIGRGCRKEMDMQKLKEAVMEVVGGKKGKEMRRKGKVVAKIMKSATMDEQGEDGVHKKGSSIEALDRFIQFALQR